MARTAEGNYLAFNGCNVKGGEPNVLTVRTYIRGEAMARGKKWPEPKKARTLKRARQLNKRMGFKMAFQQAADESGIPEETIISWHQKAKAEAQEKGKGCRLVSGVVREKRKPPPPRFPIVEPEPVIPSCVK